MANVKVYETKASSAQPAHTTSHDASHQEHGSTGMYWLIGAILAIVTTIEVFWPVLGLGTVGLVSGLVALMILKGSMVVMWFMHLKGDFTIFRFVYIVPLTLAIVFILGFLFLFNGTHPGIAG